MPRPHFTPAPFRLAGHVTELREKLTQAMAGRLPAMFGLEIVRVEHGEVDSRMDLRPEHLAPNNFLHAATVIAIADSSCGMGCIATLPEDAGGFTTIELKTNFIGTATEGALRCEARMAHGGSRTQVWDAAVSRESDDRLIAMFRCTQFILPAEDPRTEQQRMRRKEIDEDRGG